jgi:hypothetical protein
MRVVLLLDMRVLVTMDGGLVVGRVRRRGGWSRHKGARLKGGRKGLQREKQSESREKKSECERGNGLISDLDEAHG